MLGSIFLVYYFNSHQYKPIADLSNYIILDLFIFPTHAGKFPASTIAFIAYNAESTLNSTSNIDLKLFFVTAYSNNYRI